MSERTEAHVAVAASPADVLAVVTDVESYPEWNPEMRAAQVLSRDEQGRPHQVRFTIDAPRVRGDFVFAFSWHGSSGVSWNLVSGDGLESLEGRYVLAQSPTGTDVTYALAVEPAVPVLAMLRRMAEKKLADRALTGLKARVEARTSPGGIPTP